jgi:hypothetical protein
MLVNIDDNGQFPDTKSGPYNLGATMSNLDVLGKTLSAMKAKPSCPIPKGQRILRGKGGGGKGERVKE